jgi:STE24 endopeptidase
MSEMTATRMVAGATLAAAWLLAAALLWRTSVPELDLPELAAADLFDEATLERNGRYANVHAALWAGALAAQVAAIALLARRRPDLRAPLLVRGAAIGALVYATAWAAALPFRLAGHWWRRRYDVSDLDYLRFVVQPWSTTLGELALAALAGAALVGVARLVPRWTWLAVWAAVTGIAVVYVLVYPTLLAPRLRPLEDRALAAEIRQLAREAGLGETTVEVRKAKERTRAVNAEAIGAGPRTRVILWDTLLEPDVTRGEVRFVAAHELGHVARNHLWKGVAWFALFALPLLWLLTRLVPLREPSALPRAALVLLLLQLATLPAVSAITRRYEREADWTALQLTRDAAAAEAIARRFARTSLANPDPPAVLHFLRGTHPTLVERIATARAFARRER